MNRIPDPPPRADATPAVVLAAMGLLLTIVYLLSAGWLPMTP